VKFLLDVNASGPVEDWLKERHHDVVLVASRDSRMEDVDILEWAASEQRIIITTDPDFEELVWRGRRSHCGLLRLENVPRKQRLELLEDVFKEHAKALEARALIVAFQKKVRVRQPFPADPS
jgi:predicted nuclease of predicted toxin-antitoxin system